MVLSTIAIQPFPFSDHAVTALYSVKGPPTIATTPHIYPKTTFTKTVYIRYMWYADSIRYFAKITYIHKRIEFKYRTYRHKIMISIRLNQFRGNLYFLMMLRDVFFCHVVSVSLLMYVRHTIETLIVMMCNTYATASQNLLLV